MITIADREIVAYAKGGVEVFRGMLSEFPAAIIAQAAAYAIHKKCQDASGGEDVTETDAKAKASAVIEALRAGTWAVRGGGARAGNEEDFIHARLVSFIKAEAKRKKAAEPTVEACNATAAAIAKSEKPQAVALVAKFRAEWTARNTSVADLI